MKNNKHLENPENSLPKSKVVNKNEGKKPCEIVRYFAQEVVIDQKANDELEIPPCPNVGVEHT